MLRRLRRGTARLAGEQAGLSMVEVLIAIFVLSIGILGTVVSLSSSRSLSTTSQRHQLEVEVGVKTLQKIEALPYDKIALAAEPERKANTSLEQTLGLDNPVYHLTECASKCKKYQWEQSSSGAATEAPLVVEPTASTETVGPETVTLKSALTNGGTGAPMTLEVYRFYTWVEDSISHVAHSYKRVTVAVRNAGAGYPKAPVVLSTIITPPAGTSSSLESPGVECEVTPPDFESCANLL